MSKAHTTFMTPWPCLVSSSGQCGAVGEQQCLKSRNRFIITVDERGEFKKIEAAARYLADLKAPEIQF